MCVCVTCTRFRDNDMQYQYDVLIDNEYNTGFSYNPSEFWWATEPIITVANPCFSTDIRYPHAHTERSVGLSISPTEIFNIKMLARSRLKYPPTNNYKTSLYLSIVYQEVNSQRPSNSPRQTCIFT